MRKAIQFTIRVLGCLTFATCSVVYAAEDRWEFLYKNTTASFYYDKTTFTSTREAVIAWVRFTDADKNYLFNVGVDCGTGGTYEIYHTRSSTKDGRTFPDDDARHSFVIEPGSGWEQIRDVLCTKRPIWQRALGK